MFIVHLYNSEQSALVKVDGQVCVLSSQQKEPGLQSQSLLGFLCEVWSPLEALGVRIIQSHRCREIQVKQRHIIQA